MNIFCHKNDLPDDVFASLMQSKKIALDTEAMGLNNNRDRLCLVQISSGDGKAHLVQFIKKSEHDPKYDAPNLVKLLENKELLKIFHFARFDVAILQHTFKINIENIYCTKIASRLCRTYTSVHSLRELCDDLLHVKISKQHQTSDWGQHNLSRAQMEYAANDVLHLHDLEKVLHGLLKREDRLELAQSCFECVPTIARLDLMGWGEGLFAHHSI